VRVSEITVESLPLCSRTPLQWGEQVLQDPLALLGDHAALEKKAAMNALELLARWPDDAYPGWVEAMTGIARDETNHLSRVTRLLSRRGGMLERGHSNPYAKDLRALVRRGGTGETVDRLLVSALIEARSCERFSVLAQATSAGDGGDEELHSLYHQLFSSELSHYNIFVKLARKADPAKADMRWNQLLREEALILQRQEPGPRIHSGFRKTGS
jgi:tRNA-(ms[2]io[6]A)-hydroxylase